MCTKMHTPISDQIRELVTSAMAAEKVGARRFEDRHGLKRWTLRGFLDPERKQSPSIDRAQEICRAMGLDLYVAPRSLEVVGAGAPPAVRTEIEGPISGEVVGLSAPDVGQSNAKKLEGFVRVPLHDVDLAAGAGAQNDSEAAGGHLLFRQDWMRKLGLAPRDARLARVRGDSMAPLLSDRDVVLVDMAQTELPVRPRRPGAARKSVLAAIDQEGEARVKWIERPDERTLIIYSQNADLYAPEIYVGDELNAIRIIGRVVWWCHTVRD